MQHTFVVVNLFALMWLNATCCWLDFVFDLWWYCFLCCLLFDYVVLIHVLSCVMHDYNQFFSKRFLFKNEIVKYNVFFFWFKRNYKL